MSETTHIAVEDVTFGYAGTRPRLRRLVERAASRLALRPRMPW